MPVNLLTANQANGTEATNTTGFTAQGTGATLTSSTTQKVSGSRSLKVVTTGASTYQGAKINTTLLPLVAGPVTITVKAYCSVSTDYRFGISSANLSWSSYKTVALTANTWTTITHVVYPTSAAADGVISFDTGNASQAADMYLDEWGAWYGVGGDWVPAGKEVLNTGGVNSNQVDYYSGLAPISAVESNAIAAGKNDMEIDWVP